MDFIKQIKDAETQAKQIVENARKEAALLQEKAHLEYLDSLKRSHQKRIELIDKAVADAQEKTQSEVKQVFDEGKQQVEQIQKKAAGQFDACLNDIMQFLERLAG